LQSALDTLYRWCKRAPAKKIALCDDRLWQGFHAPESIPQGICRWSSANASVLLPTDNADCTVMLRLAEVRPWHGDLADGLTLRVNRTDISRQNVRFENWTVSFDLQPQMLTDYPLQRLELRCPPWGGAVGDPRTLGVPVCQVQLLPKAA
jgi:hypothetical protein